MQEFTPSFLYKSSEFRHIIQTKLITTQYRTEVILSYFHKVTECIIINLILTAMQAVKLYTITPVMGKQSPQRLLTKEHISPRKQYWQKKFCMNTLQAICVQGACKKANSLSLNHMELQPRSDTSLTRSAPSPSPHYSSLIPYNLLLICL